MKRYLNVPYKQGYHQIEVSSQDPLDQALVREAANDLLGFEIVECAPKKVVLRNIATPDPTEFESILKRLFQVTLVLAESMGGASKFDEVKDLKRTANRLTACAQRMLIAKDQRSRVWTLNLYVIVARLLRAADHLTEIALKEEIPKSMNDLIKDVRKTLELLYESFYKPSADARLQLRTRRLALTAKTEAVLNKKADYEESKISRNIWGIVLCVKAIEKEMFRVE